MKIGLPHDPAISLCVFKENENTDSESFCPPIFIATLFAKAKRWKQPKWPLMDEWIK